jgi:hypothetical protein
MKTIDEAFKYDVDLLLKTDTHLAYLSFASKYRLRLTKDQSLNIGERVKLSCLAYITLELGKEFDHPALKSLPVQNASADATT